MEASELNSINQINEQLIDFADTLIDNSSIDDIELDSNLQSILDIGNIVIGNGQWIVDDETTQESLTAEVKADVDGRIASLFDKLRDRLPLNETEEEAGNPFTEENPFANGENPFGEEEFTPPPGYENSPLPSQDVVDDIKSVEDYNSTEEVENGNPVVEDYNPTVEVESENPVIEDSNSTEEVENGNPVVEDYNPTVEVENENPVVEDSNSTEEVENGNPFAGGEGDNPFAGGEGDNPFAGGEGENPFAGGEGENPFAGGEGENPSQSFDLLGMIAGEDLPFINTSEGDYNYSAIPNQSTAETLRTIRDNLLRFNANLSYPGAFGDGNETPLQTPNDLLTLFRNDMFSFNNTANSFQELVGDDNPFSSGEYNPFGEGTLAEEIPFDILNVALDGLLPFNGSENVFSTSEGEIPIGNGNQDFGSENAVIGNANWNYGNLNATIGNGNWNWDGTSNNSTVGNGNWHLDFSVDNKTVGNGNWYWDSSSQNTTLGNGNWYFGDNNTTIGNGNWDFGNNNTVIGNGNRVYTDNSIVIGNGNWSVVVDKSAEIADDLLGELETIAMGVGVKQSADMLVDSVMNKMGEIFQPLTEDFDESALNTYNEQFIDSGFDINLLAT
ncbi:hypothetical protein NIES267_36520 [Calothrix parasitica NIES-267]|uniref:Uncharacterized protein n=1 Tax=Calothrix parasitica NIES-267 TaxID=1973488 RepID=A0A1Z4LSD4_9CYAN|nr:hypothetical protein NIES267_36520 [Calothrix parasitica NIES-267]